MVVTIRIVAGVIALIALSFGTAVPAQAIARPDSPPVRVAVAEAQGDFDSLRPHMTADAGRVVRFDAGAALASGADQVLVRETANGLAAVGVAVVGWISSTSAAQVAAAAACLGVTRQAGSYPSIDYRLDTCKLTVAQNVANGTLSVAYGVAVFTGAFGASAAAVLGIVVALSGNVIAACNSRGRGIVVTTAFGYATGCRSQ